MLNVVFPGAGPLKGYRSIWLRMTVLENKGLGPQLSFLAIGLDRPQGRKLNRLGSSMSWPGLHQRMCTILMSESISVPGAICTLLCVLQWIDLRKKS